MSDTCRCNLENEIDSSDSLEFQEKYLLEIAVNSEKWITLYKCKVCNAYWEERDLGERFGVEVKLVKVDMDYVIKEWNIRKGEGAYIRS